ncbi:MAG TPA: hypothetical protein VGD09_13440 [Blastococcus sp.]|jgi:hypothetical protein
MAFRPASVFAASAHFDYRLPALDREVDQQRSALPGRAAERDRSAHGLDPVDEPDQPRPLSGVGAADAVLADRDVQAAVPRPRFDVGYRGLVWRSE